MGQCTAKTKDSNQCKNSAEEGQELCHVHRKQKLHRRITSISAALGIFLAVLGFVADAFGIIDFIGINQNPTPTLREPIVVAIATSATTKPLSPTPTPTPPPARVEIVLDVSSRMSEELDEPGKTKLDVARDGALQLVDTFEGKLVEVALRFVTNSNGQACEISKENSLVVDFTQDLDKIRQALNDAVPDEIGEAPLTDTLSAAVNDAEKSSGPLTLFIFAGGDDTCQKSVEIFFSGIEAIPVTSINYNTFLILLLGRDEQPRWTENKVLNVSLGLVREAKDVQQITYNFGREVANSLRPSAPEPADSPDDPLVPAAPPAIEIIPTPTPTTSPVLMPTFTSPPPTFTLTPIPPTAPPKPFTILGPLNGTAYNCDPEELCIQTVTVQWVPKEQTGNLHLSIWVKPYPGDSNYWYYVQASPYPIGNSQWTSTEIYLGTIGDPIGTPFRIFALVTTDEYFRDQSFGNLPGYVLSSFVDVTR